MLQVTHKFSLAAIQRFNDLKRFHRAICSIIFDMLFLNRSRHIQTDCLNIELV